jgi:DNA-binding response OmpR family regulator
VEKALAHRQSQKQRKQLLAVMSEALQALQLEEGSSGQIISEGSSQQIELNEGRIQLDLEKRLFILQRGPGMEQIRIELTAYESALLAYLMRHPNQVHSNRDLALKALGYAHIEEVEARSIIRPHITRLRRKVEIEPTHPQLIKNIRSKGYILVT